MSFTSTILVASYIWHMELTEKKTIKTANINLNLLTNYEPRLNVQVTPSTEVTITFIVKTIKGVPLQS